MFSSRVFKDFTRSQFDSRLPGLTPVHTGESLWPEVANKAVRDADAPERRRFCAGRESGESDGRPPGVCPGPEELPYHCPATVVVRAPRGDTDPGVPARPSTSDPRTNPEADPRRSAKNPRQSHVTSRFQGFYPAMDQPLFDIISFASHVEHPHHPAPSVTVLQVREILVTLAHPEQLLILPATTRGASCSAA